MIRMESLVRMRIRNFDKFHYFPVTPFRQTPSVRQWTLISTPFGMMSIGELIPRYFSTTKRNCAEVFKCLDTICSSLVYFYKNQCCGSVTFRYGSGSDPWIRTSDYRIRLRILLFSSVTFKKATNNYFFFLIFFANYFLKLHLHQFFTLILF
jgi:hypothetical protein